MIPPGPWRRLAVTVAAIAAVRLGERITLPGIEVHRLPADLDGARLSVLAAGIVPLLGAFLLVEIAALAVPPWRPLRHSPDGRRRLGLATLVLGLLLSLAQGWVLATWVEGLGHLSTYTYSLDLSLMPSPWFRPLATVTIAAGTLSLVALAWLADRHGLLGGFATLIAASVVAEIGDLGAKWWALILQQALQPAGLLILLVLGALAVATTRKMLCAHRVTGHAPRVAGAFRLPSSGLTPIQAAAWILGLPAALAGAGLPLGDVSALRPGEPTHAMALAVLALGLAILLSLAFHRLEPLRRWLGSSPTEVSPAMLLAARREAIRGTCLYLAVLVAVDALAARSRLTFPLTAIVVGTAIVLDAVEEWRARRDHGDLVPVWPLHRLWAIDGTLDALARAGIPALARGAHQRALWHFFAPHLPVDVLVPRERAPEAAAIVRTLHEVANSPSPSSAAK